MTAESPGGVRGESTADQQPDDEGGGVSRRAILAALGITGAVGAGAAAFGGLGDGDGTGTPTPGGPGSVDGTAFDAFEAIRDAVRGSPDHLPARADDAVATGDAEAILAFVRDELVVNPPHREHMRGAVETRRWGPRGTLRGGAGAPRDIADTLASLYQAAGFEAAVVAVRPEFSTEQIRTMLFSPVDRRFEPDISESETADWRAVVGGDEDIQALDVDGEDSAALAASILDAAPEGLSRVEEFDFGWDRFDKFPMVSVTVDGESQLANPFLPEATLDDPNLPENLRVWTDIATDDYPAVEVTLSAATANDRWNPQALVSGEWSAADLAGRQLSVDMLPGVDPFQNPGVRFSDIDTFLPALTVQDPQADAATLTDLSVQGDAVTQTGATLTVDDGGVVHRDGQPLVDPADAADPATVERIEASVDAARYPDVRLSVTPRDGDGDRIEGLPASAFRVEDAEPAGVTVAATSSAPRIRMLVDNSGSMPSEYSDERIDALVPRLREAITAGHPGAIVDQRWTNSDLYRHLADAAETDANLLVYVTDGDVADELTAGYEAALRAGPPALLLNVADLHRSSLREMATLSGGTYARIADHDEAVTTVTDFVESNATDLPSYLLDYAAPTEADPGAERTVTVSVPAGDATTTTSYTVPGERVLPSRFASLQLTVDIAGWAVTRTLGGWDPVRDEDRGVTEADLTDAEGALFGTNLLSLEATPATESVWMDDILTSKLSVRDIHDAAAADDSDALDEALNQGITATPADLMLLQSRMPDAITEDSHSYQEGLRAVLHQQRPQFGTDIVIQHADVLNLTGFHTVADDPDRSFRLTAERTARTAIVEDALYDRTAKSLLEGRDLHSFGSVAGGWDTDWQLRNERVVDARPSYEHTLVPDDDAAEEEFAFWAIDVYTGEILGVLGDGSGGGTSETRIQEQLKNLSRAIAIVNVLALAAGKAGLVSGPGGLALGAVAAYGQVLARLYGQVSLAITVMDASALDRQIGLAAFSLACNLAKDLAMFRMGDDISGWIENIFGSLGGPSVC